MVERARVRCPVCRSAVPLNVLWAVGETCPRCSQPLHAARRKPGPDGLLGKTIALPRADPDRESRSSRDREAITAHADPHSSSDAKHLAAVASSLQWADEAAAREDYADALGWLQAVEATGDDLPEAYQTKRHAWLIAISANRAEG